MDDKMICNILEIKYLKMFNREITYDLDDNSDLYPNDWYINQDYELKSRILLEAIKNNKKIENTALYQSTIEGIRLNK